MSNSQTWLHTLPRQHVLLGGRAVPVFVAAGLAGLGTGATLHVLLAGLNGLSLGVALAVQALACVGFVGFGLARRRLAGRERTVLLEHVWVALALTAALLVAVGAPVRAHLDIFLPSLCVFLAFGRVGCTAAGCCYGRPSPFGIRYPEGHPAHPHRRFPIQLVASGIWAGLSVLGSVAALAAAPGVAAGTVLVVYAGIRFALESQRGDPRPQWGGLSSAQWLAAPTAVVGLALAGARGAELGLGAAALATFAGLWTQRYRWLDLRSPLELPLLDTAVVLGRALGQAELSPQVRRWDSAGLILAASAHEGTALVTLDRPDGGLVDAEAALLFDALSVGVGMPLGRPVRRGALWSVVVPLEEAGAPEPPGPRTRIRARDVYLSRAGEA